MSELNNIDEILEQKFREGDNSATGFNHFDDEEWESEWECLYEYIVNR